MKIINQSYWSCAERRRIKARFFIAVLFLLCLFNPIAEASAPIEDLITETQFNAMFPNRNAYASMTDNGFSTNPTNRALFSYDYLVQASKSYHYFCNEGTLSQRKRELAAFLANTSHETTGGWGGYVPTASDYKDRYSWGYCFPREVSYYPGSGTTAYTDASSTLYTPVDGQYYYGRGPIQLSWNYNYGAFSEAVLGDKSILLNNPEKVLEDGTIFFESAVWFWMTPCEMSNSGYYPKPSCHDVMVNKWFPTTPQQINDKILPGFPVTINIINGGLEAGLGRSNPYGPNDRLGFYLRYCEILGVEAMDSEWTGYSASSYSFSSWDASSEVHKELNAYYQSNFNLQTRSGGTYSISGFVNEYAGGPGVERVMVLVYSGSSLLYEALTDTTGAYSVPLIPAGNYTVKLYDTSLSSMSKSVTIGSYSATGINFVGSSVSKTVGISFATTAGAQVTGVSLKIQNGSSVVKDTILTSSSSASFLLTAGNTYIVTYAKSGFAFLPDTMTLFVTKDTTLSILAGSETHTVSGTCLLTGGSGVSDIELELYKESTLLSKATSSSTGAYSFPNVLSGLLVTVKPLSSSYTYTPTSFNRTVSTDITGLDFTCLAQTASINVQLSEALPGVLVMVTNTTTNAVVTATTDATGAATVADLAAGYTYVVAVSKRHVTFTSSSQSVNLTTAGATVAFTIDPAVTVAGIVVIDGAVHAGTVVQVVGQWESSALPYFSKSATTDSDGTYSISGIAAGYSSLSVSITDWATQSKWTSDESYSRTLTAPSGYCEVNFPSTAGGVAVSGAVTFRGEGLSGATVTLYNSSSQSILKSITTDALGNYTFDGVADGTYYIKVSKTDAYTFLPQDQEITVEGEDITATTVVATIDSRTYGVTVNMVTISGESLSSPDFTITASGADEVISKTTSSGTVTFAGYPIYSALTFSASASGYVVSPTSAIIVSLTKDTSLTFSARPRNLYTISTTVTDKTTGVPLSGVTVTLNVSGEEALTATTDVQGMASFSNVKEGSTGTVSYALAGHVFSPSTSSFSDLFDNLQLTSLGRVSAFTALPDNAIIGYWHGWTGTGTLATTLKLSEVDDSYNVLIVSFIETPASGTEGYGFTPVLNVAYDDIYGSKVAFIEDIKAVKAKGIPVLVSIGGQNGHIALSTPSERDTFVEGIKAIIDEYGFDGLDMDFEGGSMSFFSDLSSSLSTSWAYADIPAGKLKYTIDAVNSLFDTYGEDFILTAAPEVYYVQVGYGAYSGTGLVGAFLPVIDNLRNHLDILQVQLYNTGSVSGADGNTYSQATPNFLVAMTDMLITGFKAGTTNIHFDGLRPDQVAVGIPATPSAAPAGGFLAPATALKTLKYLKYHESYSGTYQTSEAYTTLRGVMTWSVNWDQSLDNRTMESERYLFGKTMKGLAVTTGLKPVSDKDDGLRVSSKPDKSLEVTVRANGKPFMLQVFSALGVVVYSRQINDGEAVWSEVVHGLTVAPGIYMVKATGSFFEYECKSLIQ